MQQAKVSIITPAFNAAAYIGQTIESVVAQTFSDWEMIVVDDGSSDDTLAIVRDWQARDGRIKLLINETNLGPGPSRNRAIDAAQGRFIAFLDSDDLWLPEKLQTQVDTMTRTGAYFTFTSYEVIGHDGHGLGKTVHAPAQISYRGLLKDTVIGCLTVMIDRNRVEKLAMPNIPSRQPLVLWLRLLREVGPAVGIDQILAKYRARAGSISSNKRSAAKNVWRVYREYERLGLVASLWYFINYAVNGSLRNRKIKRQGSNQ